MTLHGTEIFCECVSYIIAETAANGLAGSQKLSQEPENRLFCMAHRRCDSFYPPWNAPWPDAVWGSEY